MTELNQSSTTPERAETLTDAISQLRPHARHRMKVWAGFFVATFVVFLVVTTVQELRGFDLVFLPSLFLLVVVSLAFGFVAGRVGTLRKCHRIGEGSTLR